MASVSAPAAPTLLAPVPLDAPKVSAPDQDTTWVVTITRDEKLFFRGRSLVDLAALTSALRELVAQNPDARVAIEADKHVTHGTVIAVIDAAKQAGVSKIAFATAPQPKAP